MSFTDTNDHSHVSHLPNYQQGITTAKYTNAPCGLTYPGNPNTTANPTSFRRIHNVADQLLILSKSLKFFL